MTATKELLKNKKSFDTDGRLDFNILLAHAIKKPKEFIFSHPEYRLNLIEKLRLAYYRRLLKKSWPVAYITKHKEFCGLDFYVSKNALIPRPETEIIVEETVKLISNQTQNQNIKNTDKSLLIDIGTGSGCIPISILATMEQCDNGIMNVIATDISKKALRVAKKNAKKHGVKINFLHGKLLEPILKQHNDGVMEQWKKIIITANLPYLTKAQFQSSPTIQREPYRALVADNISGLSLYEKLLEQIKQLVSCYMSRVSCFLEIDPSQSPAIQQLVKKYLPNANIKIKKDLAGLNRVIFLSKS